MTTSDRGGLDARSQIVPADLRNYDKDTLRTHVKRAIRYRC